MIRLACMDELEEIIRIYNKAQDYMAQKGNPSQWGKVYPPKELIIDDIEKKQLYVVDINHNIEGVFVYSEEKDPTYAYIENGAWLNDEPYSVVHRVASAMNVRHIGSMILEYSKSRANNVRIDTHDDNKPMQNLLEKNGFKYVGTIYIEDGSPRRAYHWYNDCNLSKNSVN